MLRGSYHQAQIFAGLSEMSLQKLLASSMQRQYKKGQLLLQQGDPPAYLYLVLDGSIKTFHTNQNGHEAVIRMLSPGDTCMDAVIFMDGYSPIAVEAVTNSRLLLIPRATVKSLAMEDPSFAYNLLRIITHHYKNAIRQIDAVNTKTPFQRLGSYLLLKHLEKGHNQLNFTFSFKKSVIASYLGITPETFSRALRVIKKLGLEVEGEKITLRNTYVLCSFCNLDSAAICCYHHKEKCPLRRPSSSPHNMAIESGISKDL